LYVLTLIGIVPAPLLCRKRLNYFDTRSHDLAVESDEGSLDLRSSQSNENGKYPQKTNINMEKGEKRFFSRRLQMHHFAGHKMYSKHSRD